MTRTGSCSDILRLLPRPVDIRTGAGLNSLTGTVSSQADVRKVIADERRLELAFEGHKWFNRVRTRTANQ
ncbi:MAG: RagB/SusD family nutrient uptake outer membrane protein [Lutimonas sp.]